MQKQQLLRGLANIPIASTLPLLNPVYLFGKTEKGFGRGSSLLKIPTANLPAEKFSKELSEIDNGVYFGWANISSGPVYKTVLSIGNNPYFKDERKTIEPHILHKFGGNLYGEELRLIVVGYIRGMMANFNGVEELRQRILKDIEIGRNALDLPEYSMYKSDKFFKDSLYRSTTPINYSNNKKDLI